MKKVNIVLLVVFSILIVMAWCIYIPKYKAMMKEVGTTDTVEALTEAIEVSRPSSSAKAQLVESDIRNSARGLGKYSKEAFPKKYFTYQFEDADIVVYYLFGEEYMIAEKNTERWYAMVSRVDEKFLALSSKYMLFLTNEGKIAVELAEIKIPIVGNLSAIMHEEIPFEDLSISEQESFVYPSSVEKVEENCIGWLVVASICQVIVWWIFLRDRIREFGIKFILRMKARKANQ